jgi:hypothetical protein
VSGAYITQQWLGVTWYVFTVGQCPTIDFTVSSVPVKESGVEWSEVKWLVGGWGSESSS